MLLTAPASALPSPSQSSLFAGAMTGAGPAPGALASRPAVPPPAPFNAPQLLKLDRLQRQFQAYLGTKVQEIEEAREARRYYHHVQWTPEQIETLRRRGQPVVTIPRVGRKIDGVVGLTEQQRQDPKAYARNPRDEAGASLATAVVRYITETNEWVTKKPGCMATGMVDGFAGVELKLVEGDHDDPDIEIAELNNDEVFYDPRSIKPGFTDARYLGVSKFLDVDEAVALFPEHEQLLEGLVKDDARYSIPSDRELKWVDDEDQRIRLVEHWYKLKGDWYWAFYVGTEILAEGISPYKDQRGKTMCRFLLFSTYIDQDGDRYGFVRALKGMQDEINQRRSKALALASQRRIITEEGAVDDMELARREAVRPDGLVVVNPGKRFEFDDKQVIDFESQLKFLQDAKDEMEAYANINPAALAGGSPNLSGRAVNLLQKPGLAEIWKPISHYRNWNLRVYKAVWCMAQQFWTSERWIRVTDDRQVQQHVQVNGMGVDQYGQTTLVNMIGALDVDIIMDEGPDVQTAMQDTWDVMAQLLPGLPPASQPPADILVSLLPIDSTTKQKWEDHIAKAGQPDPARERAKQLALDEQQAKNEETAASAALKKAQTVSALASAAHKAGEAHMNGAAVFAGGAQSVGQPAPGSPQPAQPQPPQQPAPMPSLPPPAAMAGAPVTPGAAPGVSQFLANAPPVPGARRAPDGHWYVEAPHAGGRYQRVV